MGFLPLSSSWTSAHHNPSGELINHFMVNVARVCALCLCVCVCVCVFCKAHRKQMPALIRSSLLIFWKVMVSNHLENSWVMFDFLSRLCPCCVCVCVLQRANSGACTLPHSPSLCNWSQPSPVKNKNHLSAARVCPLKMHGGGSWGPLGKKADTRLSGRASEYQGGQMASSEKEGDGEGD